MDVLVVGGHGKIALRLLRLLAARGHRARGLIRKPEQAADIQAVGAVLVVGDLEVEPTLEPYVRGADAVVLAGMAVAAWDESADWLDALRTLLAGNRALMGEWAAGLPLSYTPPEATYLAWLGGVAHDESAALLERTAKVKLSEGADFSAGTGVDTATFVRLNFATGPEVLRSLPNRLTPALAGISGL